MEEFFINKYGPQALEVLSTPPMFSSIRVNVLKIDVLSAVEDIRKIYPEMEVTVHHLIPDLILIRSQGPFEHQPVGVEVYVDYKCGEAVLRGSHIYSPGILGSSSSCNKNSVDRGTSISVFAIEKSLPRGFKSQISSSKYFLGNGISHQSRKEITTNNKGLALTLTSPKWKMPSFSSLSPSLYYPQNIGSASVGHILRVKPNQPSSSDQILDMCAAPGGKTSHLSTLMNNQGSITACDKSSSRLDSLKSKKN
jgi:16S rRNA C967 or C1407 C5-methylase (RsmB/RsmF family)